MRNILFQRGSLALLLLCCSLWVSAQAYPGKIINLVAPFAKALLAANPARLYEFPKL
jgi:hypothetical protein